MGSGGKGCGYADRDMTEKIQKSIDDFYRKSGVNFCAGCDWWRFYNSLVGECTKSAPVPAEQRTGMIGIEWTTLAIGAGHVMTLRSHTCGDFVDNYDWRKNP